MNFDITIAASMVLYLIFMVGVGFYFMKKNQSPSDYFLGNRKLGAWVSSVSAQASDMSAWVLMGLPGAVYATGLLEGWTALGLIIGTYLNWLFVAKRLRQYTKVSGDSITLPQYFTNRFRDKTGLLRILPAIFILIFFLFYTASGFVAGAKLFNVTFGLDPNTGLLLTVAVILVYTIAGGFLAVCWTDFFQGILILLAVVLVPAAAVASMGGIGITYERIMAFNPSMLNPLTDLEGTSIAFVTIVSCMAWGLGYFGQPHIVVRFMGISNPKNVAKSRKIAMVWAIFCYGCAIVIGLVGRAFFMTEALVSESVYISLAISLFPGVIAGVLLSALLAATMSTADSQLLVASSAIAGDFYKAVLRKEASDKELMWVSRITVAIIALVAAAIAANPDQKTVMALVSFAWGGLGATFGPIILFSLYWKRTNVYGAIAGILSGGITALVWYNFIKPFGGMFSVYEILPAFIVSSIVIYVVSKMTKEPDDEIIKEFETYAECEE